MDKGHIRPFGGGSGVGGGGGPGGVGGGGGGEYSQIVGGSDSDDSRSSTSRSEDNEGIPCIVYTSDDSADVGQSDSTCVDSEGMGYIADNVHQMQDDESSRRLLLDSSCPSPQPSPQPESLFLTSHPLAAMTFSTGSDSDITQDDLGLRDGPVHHNFTNTPHLRVHTDVCDYERSASISSASSGSSPEAQLPLLPEYRQLPDFENFGDVGYEPLHDQAIAAKKLHDPLDMFVDVTDIPNKIKSQPCFKFYIL